MVDIFIYICFVMKKRFSSFIICLLCLCSNLIFAAGGPQLPPPEPFGGPVPPGEPLPLDSSLIVLFIIAIVYFVVDYKRRQKSNQLD